MTPRDDETARPGDTIKAAARAWVLRHDRGLTAHEAREFDTWLEADPRHAEAWEQSSGIWNQLDLLGKNAAAFLPPAPARRPWLSWTIAATAAAAAVVMAYVAWRAPEARPRNPPAAIAAAEPRVLQLADGTTVYLKAGSELLERFTPAERRVLLVRGEALFEVAKGKDWPFVVRAGKVEVRAVGTAFNVQLQAAAVEVRVTEGQVRVTPDQPAGAAAGGQPLVSAGQRAVVDLAPNTPATVQVFPMDTAQRSESLALKDPLLQLGGSTLEELAVEFERRTGRLLVLADPELKKLRVGGQIRGDNVEGFVWVLENIYGLRSERAPDGNIVLHKAP
jgi:transmembrane sensor